MPQKNGESCCLSQEETQQVIGAILKAPPGGNISLTNNIKCCLLRKFSSLSVYNCTNNGICIDEESAEEKAAGKKQLVIREKIRIPIQTRFSINGDARAFFDGKQIRGKHDSELVLKSETRIPTGYDRILFVVYDDPMRTLHVLGVKAGKLVKINIFGSDVKLVFVNK